LRNSLKSSGFFTAKEEALAELFKQDFANLLRKLGYAVYSGYIENHEG
jgi:hypothetical protein